MREAEPKWTRTACPYCGVGCGVLASAEPGGESALIKGDPDHPANFGRLCSKGAALGETLSLDDRLLYPEINRQRANWDAALDRVSSAFTSAIAEHGPDSVALYVSGQILTEDYYVANKLVKGFFGTANIDTNSRLCMASSVAGHKRAFGSDTVPGVYEDLEEADLVVLVGSNLAWCHPVLFQRLSDAQARRGTKIIVVDPRETATCQTADLHLPLKPGTDVALFNGLLKHISEQGAIDHVYVAAHTAGLDAALAVSTQSTLFAVSATTGLHPALINRFYDLFTRTKKVVTVYSQGVNQSCAGTDKVNAILNCHLATGRIGQPGAGPFSVTGQPNAMGGREVGGLANMLAAHMELANPEHRELVQAFWKSPHIASTPGLKAVDLFRAVAAGQIKVLWIMGTNPVDSLPDADAVREALRICPTVVVSDVVRKTDTTALANVLLPAAAWGEKDGTVTNSERRISRQRAFLPTPGEARPDWWQICEVARRMGFADAFDYETARDIFVEYAALTGVASSGDRDLDISACADLAPDAYDRLEPFQWPWPKGQERKTTRFFANGAFFTDDRRARFVETPYRPPVARASPDHALILNTGRLRDHWHTMTRTAKAPRLSSHCAEPFVEVHPRDADRAGVASADIAVVCTDRGEIKARAVVTERVQPGTVFVPMHWTDQYASAGRIGTLIAGDVDPVSGQPELKHTPVSLTRFPASWFGFVVTEERLALTDLGYAAVAPCVEGGWRAEIAGVETPADWTDLARKIFTRAEAQGAVDFISYQDRATGQHRFARFVKERCTGLLFLAPSPVHAARSWASAQIGVEMTAGERLTLLAGRHGADMPDKGPIVCSCLGVGRNEIIAAITTGACESCAAVGEKTGAGTNCGSCRSEIGRLIDDTTLAQAV